MAQVPTIQVGYDEVDITPPKGGSIPAYFPDRLPTATPDPLKPKGPYLAPDKERSALVASHLIGMGPPTLQRTPQAAAALSKSPPRHIWVHCTHTHTGGLLPRGDGFTSDAEKIYPGFYQGTVNDKWVQQTVDGIAAGVVRAAGRAAAEKEVTLHVGREAT